MNQPLNYVVNGTRYYYDLDTSQWYTLDKDNQIKYIDNKDWRLGFQQ
jgi:hypothetical protein